MNALLRSYWKKVKTIIVNELQANASPVRASVSLAFGVLVGFSPLYGLHLVIAVPLAFIARLNRPLVLLGVGTTVLPVVPFWIAAGIFTGKIVVPLEKVRQIIMASRGSFPGDLLDRAVGAFVNITKHLLPADLIEKIREGAGQNFAAGFVQWVIGCTVLAIIAAVATFIVTYPLFLQIRKRKLLNRRTVDELNS